ncbi:uncharacterized protein J4E88_007382 [Alternaria novae-zelandiae]|uniref:uncharacterized protein n=1 Tax=Alternaria novae-zelandiae TaxID=430562 RepID=UPI0020C44D90|nr:uncharacterized protein J4E88_007382 [Alternaria novae-zelandiae]KAI4676464.1 hypothetical protein J4E88_007382 [Alternaria novae-zelandiae]
MAQPATAARRTLYNDPTFSDIKIRQIYKGQVKEYVAHKAVLCAHSGWFMAALTGRFMEASADIIEVHEDDPETFQRMMEFFYDMDLDVTTTPSVTPTGVNNIIKNEMVPIIELHGLADKYDAKILQKAALVAFKTGIGVLHVVPAFEPLAKLINAHYSNCPGTMDAMSQAIVKYIYKMSANHLSQGLFNKLAAKHSNFGADLYLLGRADGKLVFN